MWCKDFQCPQITHNTLSLSFKWKQNLFIQLGTGFICILSFFARYSIVYRILLLFIVSYYCYCFYITELLLFFNRGDSLSGLCVHTHTVTHIYWNELRLLKAFLSFIGKRNLQSNFDKLHFNMHCNKKISAGTGLDWTGVPHVTNINTYIQYVQTYMDTELNLQHDTKFCTSA